METEIIYGRIIWLMGPTSSGKTTIARHLVDRRRGEGHHIFHYDGDEVRNFFGRDIGFNSEDRLRVVKTLVYLANKTSYGGIDVVVSALTANKDARIYIGTELSDHLLVYLTCSLTTCMARDPKGLYERARIGEIDTLIGYNTEYLPPENPDLVLSTEQKTVEDCTDILNKYLDGISIENKG